MKTRPLERISVRSFALAVALLALCGCVVGPDPQDLPAPAVPAAFREAEAPATEAPAAEAPTAEALGDTPWWESFSDPALTHLVTTGLENNADVRAAATRVAEARAALGIRESALYPNLDATASAGRVRESDNQPLGGGTFDYYGLGFGTAWELDLWGRVRRSVEAASFDATAADSLLLDMQRSIGAEIAAQYIQVRGFQRQLETTRRGVEIQTKLASITDAMLERGAAKPEDADRAHARLSRTRSGIPPLEAAVKVGTQRLALLCVLPPEDVGALVAAPSRLPETPLPPGVSVPSTVLRARPDVAAAASALSAEVARIGVAEADLLPRISLSGNLGLSSTDIDNLFSSDSVAFGVGPSIRWPLFNFGRVRSQIRAQGARKEAALIRYEQVVRQAVAEVEMALAERRGALRQRDTLRQASEASTRAQKRAQVRYERGADPLFSVLDAERERLEIGSELASSQVRLLLADVALRRALGIRGDWGADATVH